MTNRNIELVDLASADPSPTVGGNLVHSAEAHADVVGLQPGPVRGQAAQIDRAVACFTQEDERRRLWGTAVPGPAPAVPCCCIKGRVIRLLQVLRPLRRRVQHGGHGLDFRGRRWRARRACCCRR